MTDNPYASPAMPADLALQQWEPPKELKIASQGKRFLNLILDSIVMQIMSAAVGFVVGIAVVFSSMRPDGTLPPDTEFMLNVIGYPIGFAVSLAYFILCEHLFQRTPAKFLTGTLVVTDVGLRPTFMQVVGRSFARFIPFEAFSFLGGNQPVGWHDKLSGTRVIDVR